MPEAIKKDIYVMQCGLPVTVDYVQATNAIPIVFDIRDYTIPSGAEARLYIKKPSGKEVYNPASISENTVTINPTTQMFAEFGHQKGQLQIVSGEKTLVTFPIVFHVSRNMISESAVESTNEYTILDQLIVDARSAVSAANSAVKKAEEAVGKVEGSSEKADEAARRANEAAEKVEGLEVSGLLDQISDVKEEMDVLAPGIIETATGESIVLDDSSDKPMAGLHIYGKSDQFATTGAQLLNVLKSKQTVGNLDEVRNDGFTWTYTSENDSSRIVNIPCDLKKGVRYVADAIVSSSLIRFYLPETDQYISKQTPFIPNENVTIFGVYVHPDENVYGVYEISNLILNEGSTPKPFEPYTGGKSSPSPEYPQEVESAGDSGTVDVNVFGKNLFDASLFDTSTQNGVTVTNNGDGSFTIKGNSNPGLFTQVATIPREQVLKMLKPGELTMEVETTTNPYPIFSIRKRKNNGSHLIIAEANGLDTRYSKINVTQEMLDNPDMYVAIGFVTSSSSSYPHTNATITPMVHQHGDGTWEPYKPVQTLTLQTLNGLPGIPVKSDGNYTDSSGQQWICDEIDLERGKYVQRVERYLFDGSEDEKWSIIIDAVTPSRKAAEIALTNRSRTRHDTNILVNIACPLTWTNLESPYYCFINEYRKFVFRIHDLSHMYEDILDIRKWISENNIVLMYILETPIERDLTSEEIQQYKQLHTNYPNTTILNSETTGMKVGYVADTKAYICKKIESPLQKQITDLQNALISAKISGGGIKVADSARLPILGLKIFGKSTQEGVPSLEAPVPIVSAGYEGNITVTIENDINPQTLTLQSPNGLPGIPVSQDGNYTDKTGQQWICDEIDLERGKYVQRMNTITVTSDNDIWLSEIFGFPRFQILTPNGSPFLPGQVGKGLCNAFKVAGNPIWNNDIDEIISMYKDGHVYFRADRFKTTEEFKEWLKMNPLDLIYALYDDPIERDLTPEEIQQYKQLCTNYPITIISNNAGADMELTYTLDTKTYVDTKITDISRAVIAQKGI